MEAIRKSAKRDVKFYDVDIDLLKDEARKRNENLASLSKGIGYCGNYLSGMCQKNKDSNKSKGIPERAAMLLYERYNIRIEDIVRKEEPPVLEVIEPEETEDTHSEPFKMDWQQLYNTIYAAVYAAMRKALNEK